MKTAWNEVIKYAVIANLLHLGVCLIYSNVQNGSSVLSIVTMVLLFLIYGLIGFKYSSTGELKKESSIFTLSLVTLLPIILFLIVGQILEGINGFSVMQNYVLFYIIGAPILFWHRPFETMMTLFNESSIYIQLDINVATVVLFLIIGGFAGSFWRKVKRSKGTKENQLQEENV